MKFSESLKSLLGNAIAHSARNDIPEQLLSDHVAGVLQRCCAFASRLGLEQEATFCALWHDLGKLTDDFQYKLTVSHGMKVDHKGFGALWSINQQLLDVAFVIAGHHGGMPDAAELKNKCTAESPDAWNCMSNYKQLKERIERIRPEELFPIAKPDYEKIARDPLAADFRTRLLYSCLVDADYLDTEANYDKGKRDEVTFPELSELADFFRANQAELILKRAKQYNKDEQLYKLRCEVSEQARQKGDNDQGVFSLTVPTGGGKSRAALGFAFQHAERHSNIQRIIVVLPYTSILDQLAQEYEEIFGANNFLLHYTGWQSRMSTDAVEETPEEKAMILAAENWDAPLILTTTVQFFDSLFSNKPSDCRKLHRIANSVIILDEVQMLPLKYLEPICDVLGRLVQDYGATVVLSTATQPALDQIPSFRTDRIMEIVDNPEHNYEILKRVNYLVEIQEPWSWEDVAVRLLKSESGMVVVNTKRHALELFELVKEKDSEALHLSTYMCGAHRRQVIEEIRIRLKNHRRCRVVATQLVEAGVDLDFPLVMRAVGPLDRIVQAAGRCNREGKLGYAGGKVVVFKPDDNAMPAGSYRTGAAIFEAMFRSDRFVPDDPMIFPAYFKRLFNDVNLDADDIQGNRRHLNFETVARNFHLIDHGAMLSLYVGFGGAGNRWDSSPAQKLLEQVSACSVEQRRLRFRRLQPYSVQVFAKRLTDLLGQGLVVEHKLTGQYLWLGTYSNDLGIATNQFEIESMIQ